MISGLVDRGLDCLKVPGSGAIQYLHRSLRAFGVYVFSLYNDIPTRFVDLFLLSWLDL